jgi:hypothetical protein
MVMWGVEWHVQICIGKKILLTYPISKQKVGTRVICGLCGNKIGDKEIPMDYVGVKLVEMFKLESMVPFGEMTMDSCKSKVKKLLGVVSFWWVKTH